MVYNVHSLLHITDDVQQFGPLSDFSAFNFENYLRQFKKLLNKPNQPLKQICQRLSEIQAIQQNDHPELFICNINKQKHCESDALFLFLKKSNFNVQYLKIHVLLMRTFRSFPTALIN